MANTSPESTQESFLEVEEKRSGERRSIGNAGGSKLGSAWEQVRFWGMDGDVHAGGCILTVHGEWAPVCSLWNIHCLGFVAGVQENCRLCVFLQAVHEAA